MRSDRRQARWLLRQLVQHADEHGVVRVQYLGLQRERIADTSIEFGVTQVAELAAQGLVARPPDRLNVVLVTDEGRARLGVGG